MKKIFKAGDSFRAYYDAENWLKDQGMYSGSMQSDSPIGISKEDWICSYKWRHLSKEVRNELDGVICSNDMRDGDVTVIIFDNEDKKENYIKLMK